MIEESKNNEIELRSEIESITNEFFKGMTEEWFFKPFDVVLDEMTMFAKGWIASISRGTILSNDLLNEEQIRKTLAIKLKNVISYQIEITIEYSDFPFAFDWDVLKDSRGKKINIKDYIK